MISGHYPLGAGWRVLVKDLGLQASDVMRRAGLPDDLLNQHDAHLAPEDFYRFWESMDAALGDEHFAIRFHQTLKAEAFFPPLFAALCSPNYLIAAQRVAQYKSLVAPMKTTVREEQAKVVVELKWLKAKREPPVSLVMSDLLFAVNLARVGTREHLIPLAVSTPHLPKSLGAYTEILGLQPHAGPAHSVVFSREDALRPFLTADNSLWEMFEVNLRQRLSDLEGSVTTRERTRAALLEGLPSGVIGMEAVAKKLAMSKRTLQRRLDSESCTFKEVLDETRQELAQHYLQATNFTSPEISFLLGFEETTSFYRAFNRWTGRTPEKVRQAAAPGG